MADGPLAWVLVGGALMGAAFGFSWAFMSRRLLAALSDEDRAIGSSAITAVRQTGAAAGRGDLRGRGQPGRVLRGPDAGRAPAPPVLGLRLGDPAGAGRGLGRLPPDRRAETAQSAV